MDIFKRPASKVTAFAGALFPAALLLLLCLFFLLAINRTSDETIKKEQITLEQALQKGAVHTYALEGRYPESLTQLLDDYGITYDTSKFVVEYVPEGANLLPRIAVIPLA